MNLGLSTEFGLRDGQVYIIGREGDIQIDSPTVSKQHAEMIVKHRRVYLRDLKSKNGIFLVTDKRLVRLNEGYVNHDQLLMIGKVKCTLRSLLSANFGKSDSRTNGSQASTEL
ncbi:MAG: FHA domain-containing protein [Gammaproteobacteria bacterium]|nr:MAG: FHA domain-containing protein [Gammaproteobacteria bacterium]